MKLLFATGNDFKFKLMQDRLSCFEELELINPKMLGINIEVDENGVTAEENATIKARAYYEATGIPTIAEDSGLYIDKFKSEEQPGLYVKRVNGVEGLSDEEILNYYINKLNNYNGRSLAHYFTGVCVIDEDGNITSDTIDEEEFLLTVDKCKRVNLKGGILEPISFDLDAEKYFAERTPEEEEFHYKSLNDRYREIIKNSIIEKGKARC